MKFFFKLLIGSALLLTLCACSSPWITNTPRSAIEQMLLSTVIERNIEQFNMASYKSQTAYLDYDYLTTQTDKTYVQGVIEMHLAQNGILITRDQKKANIIIQVTCGVLATDHNKILVGTPELPIPLPNTNLNFSIPEIPLFMKQTRCAYGRFNFNILEPETRQPIASIAGINSYAEYVNWVIMLVPFKTHNLPMAPTKVVESDYESGIF